MSETPKARLLDDLRSCEQDCKEAEREVRRLREENKRLRRERDKAIRMQELDSQDADAAWLEVERLRSELGMERAEGAMA